MAGGEAPPTPELREEANGPPCKRCGSRRWKVERRLKGRLRLWAESAFAAPDVWIFQSESGGWPDRHFEIWTCESCGRRVRVSASPRA